jgi:oxygen-dependent protoporphyrinogen oxidase
MELGLADEIIPSNDAERRTYLLRDGRLAPMPDGMRMMVPTDMAAVDASPLFSDAAREAYRSEPVRAEELKARGLADGADESVASFVRRHFGDEATRTIAGPLLAGVFGGDIEKLSVRAVMPAFVKMEREHGSLIRALEARAAATDAGAVFTTLRPVFTTLRSGLGTLIERVAATLPEERLRLREAVMGLRRDEQKWKVRTNRSEQTFDAVVVASPAHVTRRLLGEVDARFGELLAIQATSAIVVALAFDAEEAAGIRIPPGFGYLVPQGGENDLQLLACTFVDQKFAGRAPAGGVLLRAFFGGNAGKRLMHEHDDTLVMLAEQRMTEVLGRLPHAHLSVVRRWPHSLPQYAVGHLARMEELERLVASFPGLRLAGNAYYGVGLPDMVRMGREAGKAVIRD